MSVWSKLGTDPWAPAAFACTLCLAAGTPHVCDCQVWRSRHVTRERHPIRYPAGSHLAPRSVCDVDAGDGHHTTALPSNSGARQTLFFSCDASVGCFTPTELRC